MADPLNVERGRIQEHQILNIGAVDNKQDDDDEDGDGLILSQSHHRNSKTYAAQLENEEQATQPTFNNQNTILMAARSCHGDLMLMHETRIFYFTPTTHQKATIANVEKYGIAADSMTNLILRMLTTRKYRLLTSFYLLWHIMDYAMLASLLLALFFTKEHEHFGGVIWKHIGIVAVVGLEVFYSVLQNIVKIWILNRVSIYIGFVLYALYAIAFTYPHDIWDPLVIWLFSLRAMSFIFELFIDYCIDLELEYDLYHKKINKLDVPMGCSPTQEEKVASLSVTHNNAIEFPNGWCFKGSVCAWNWKNTFKCDVEQKSEIHTAFRFVFHVMFAITYVLAGVFLLVIIGITIGVLSVLQYICCSCFKKTDTICGEFSHRYSY